MPVPAWLRCALVAALAALAVLASPTARAEAAPGDIGFQDFAFDTDGSGGFSITGSKPESKLWFNDGAWWADMAASGGAHRIHRLDRATGTWVPTATALDPRFTSVSDVLWDGTKLYVASHADASSSSSASSGTDGRLYRFSYDPGTGYRLDPGFPVTIGSPTTETLVIDEDSTGRLWATWMAGGKVYVNATTGAGSAETVTWGTPFVISSVQANSDDISSLIAFDGKVAVIWSSQTPGEKHQGPEHVWFATHTDGAPDGAWSSAIVDTGSSPDDHFNMKADAAGNLYVATKTSEESSSAPFILLLKRSPAGTWTSSTVSRVSDSTTRPIVTLDAGANVLHVFMTCPRSAGGSGQSGGDICEKTAPAANPVFPVGLGTPVLRDNSSPNLNDVTSAKGVLDGSTGIVVLASDKDTNLYWHSDRPLAGSGTAAPRAAFGADVTTGAGSLTVRFTDGSSGGPTAWAWSFGDGAISTERNPVHTYGPGTYDVTLRASNAAGSSTVTARGLITVTGAGGPGGPPGSGGGAEPHGDGPVAGAGGTVGHSVALTATETVVPYGLTATVRVRVGDGAAGVPLQLQASPFPFSAPLTNLIAPGVSGPGGTAALRIPDVRRTMRVLVIADGRTMTGVETIRSAVRLTRVRVRRAGAGRARVSGVLAPVTAEGRLRVERRDSRRRWHTVVRAHVPRSGRFALTVRARRGVLLRVVAVPGDGGAHVTGRSAGRRVPSAG